MWYMKPYILLVVLSCVLVGCTSENAKTQIISGGASFPDPLYQKWFSEYEKKHNVQINYQPIGSGGGQKQLMAEIFQFAGSDAIMTDKILAEMREKGRVIHHFPTTLAAVAIIFNIENVTSLKLTPDLLSDIYLGKITTWNDPRILEYNSDMKEQLKGNIRPMEKNNYPKIIP